MSKLAYTPMFLDLSIVTQGVFLNSKDFGDIQSHWTKDAIDFVSARGLVNGINPTLYSSNASATRAQLWTILARQADAELNSGANWYEKPYNYTPTKGE